MEHQGSRKTLGNNLRPSKKANFPLPLGKLTTLLANITPRLGTCRRSSCSPDCCVVALFHVLTSGSGNHLLIPPPFLLFPGPRGTESKPLDHLRAPSCRHLPRESSRCAGTWSPGSRRAKRVPAAGLGVLGTWHGEGSGTRRAPRQDAEKKQADV